MPSKGPHFYIKSYMNGYCLDVEGNSTDPGAKVVLYHAKPVDEADNQLWYMDAHTLTIRNVMTDFCLEIDDNGRVNPYDEGNPGQMWAVAGDFLLNLEDGGKVLDVVGESSDLCADICSWERHGKVNQRWYFEHVPRKHFRIVSRLNEDKVLDISGNDDSAGAEVIIYDKNDEPVDNQLWFCDRSGLIRSKLNGFVLDGSDGDIKMQECERSCHDQGFVFSNGRMLNLHRQNRVVDIKGNSDDNGTNICEWDFHGGDNQLWRLEFVNIG